LKPNKPDLAKLLPEARALVSKVIQKNMAEGILFSAGTDTSIIAYEAVKYNPKIKALTVSFKQGKPKDNEYVKKMVDFLNLDHEFHVFDIKEAINAAKDVVKVLKTFDPMDVRNTVPAYIGLTVAKRKASKAFSPAMLWTSFSVILGNSIYPKLNLPKLYLTCGAK